jgi:hypothetical protein
VNDSTAFHVFLAHAKEDKPLVREVFFLLQLDGFLPWLDEESLLAGQDWEFEIKKAVKASHVVVLFISPSGVDRAGYLHKEIALAVDVAEQQPEGTIYLIPVRLGECEMPRRLSHLHWLVARHELLSAAGIYSTLQSSLLARARDLRLVTDDQLRSMPSKRTGGKGEAPLPLQEGRYLVRGQNPDGSKYYGIAEVKISNKKYEMTSNISGRVIRYEGEAPQEYYDNFTLRGDYDVTYAAQSWTGIYQGTWGHGGIEELIPASPLMRPVQEKQQRPNQAEK